MINNREIATAIWIAVSAPLLLNSNEIRIALTQLIRAFLSAKVLMLTLLMATHVTVVVLAMQRAHLWDPSLLKDTVLWFSFVSIATMVRFVTARGALPVRALVFDNLKIITVFEFVVNTYTFALGYELAMVPIVTLLAALTGFTEAREEYRSVRNWAGGILVAVGSIAFVHALASAISDFQTINFAATLKAFALPLLLSLSLLPGLYLLAVLTHYESLFIGFTLGAKRERRLVRYSKWAIFRSCFLSIVKISRLRPCDLMQVTSREDVERLLAEVDSKVHPTQQGNNHTGTRPSSDRGA